MSVIISAFSFDCCFLIFLECSNYGAIIFAGILLFVMFISVGFQARVVISTCISHIPYFILWNSEVFWSFSLVFRILLFFCGIPRSFGHRRLYFAYFFLKWNSEVFWSFSPVFLDYSSEASRTTHRFYEISLFCQFGFTVFSWFFCYLSTVACYDYNSKKKQKIAAVWK